MTPKNYAFLKNNQVVNVAIFDNPSEETLELFKQEFNLDLILEDPGNAVLGGTWDGVRFWNKKPYESWVKGTDDWEAPIPYPTDGKVYFWNEETVNWSPIS